MVTKTPEKQGDPSGDSPKNDDEGKEEQINTNKEPGQMEEDDKDWWANKTGSGKQKREE
jgi:hypothetical protein